MARRLRKANQRFAQSDLDSQTPVDNNSLYVPRLGKFPADYPKAKTPSPLPRYVPWPNSLPGDYPGANNKPAPFRRLKTADLRVVKRMESGGKVAGSIKPPPYVLSTFDARPINTIDFVDTFSAGEVVGDTFTGTFQVPGARTAIFRNLSLRVYMTAAARGAQGEPLANLTLSFLINNTPVDGYAGIRVDDAACSATFSTPLVIPMYWLAPEGSTVTILIVNTAAAMDIAVCAPVLTGNLLLSEGVNPTSEPGTMQPLPTQPF